MSYTHSLLFVSMFLFACNENNTALNIEAEAEKIDTDTIITPDTFIYPDQLNLDFLMGRFEPSAHERFVRIDDSHTNKSNIYLDREVYNAFLRMHNDALKAGFRLIIVSATRNFHYQKRIWDYKWSGLPQSMSDEDKTLKILEYSSMPGSSRHHWGTDIDLNVLDNSYYDEGEGKRIYDWLKENAHNYGFCQPYTAGRETGYHEEKWHWSYLPLSSIYTRYALEFMKDIYIEGFRGAEFAPQLNITENYILSIDEYCL